MITEQKAPSQWKQALVENWKGCAPVRMTLEQIQPGDVILAQYTRPRTEDSPPLKYTDSTGIFVVLEKQEKTFPNDFHALQIATLSTAGQLLGSVSWGTTTLPEGAILWLLGSCRGERVSDARWRELSLNETDNPINE